jgi:hypothetical protein
MEEMPGDFAGNGRELAVAMCGVRPNLRVYQFGQVNRFRNDGVDILKDREDFGNLRVAVTDRINMSNPFVLCASGRRRETLFCLRTLSNRRFVVTVYAF